VDITLSLDDKLVKKLYKITIERHTTITDLVRMHLEKLAPRRAPSGRNQEQEALELTFRQFQFHVGKRTWRRENLHHRRDAFRR